LQARLTRVGQVHAQAGRCDYRHRLPVLGRAEDSSSGKDRDGRRQGDVPLRPPV